MEEPNKCGCGLTKDKSGNCDGSHTSIKKGENKLIPYNQITVRCISLEGTPQKVKSMYPAIANNKRLMNSMKFTISDPLYEAKMKSFKNKEDFDEKAAQKESVKAPALTPKAIPTKPPGRLSSPPKKEGTPAIVDKETEKSTADKTVTA